MLITSKSNMDLFKLLIILILAHFSSSYYNRKKNAYKSKYFSGKCRDLRPDCSRFKKWSWCISRKSIMNKVCRATCQFCEQKCKDVRGDCFYLSSLGWCKYQRGMMKKVCAKSCKYCKPKKPSTTTPRPTSTPKPTTTTPPPTTRPPTTATPRRRRIPCRDLYGKVRCEYFRYLGWCEKDPNMAYYCRKTCKCNRKTRQPTCRSSRYGCCWDNKTSKLSRNGRGCPRCVDDRRFYVLCDRFRQECNGKGGLGKSVRKYCPKTCTICCKCFSITGHIFKYLSLP